MVETACEAGPTCNVDQRSFKAYLARFMTYARVMAPWTAERIKKKIQGSAIAAASKCNFGADRNTCGLRWTEGEWEGYYGVGEQLSALEVIQSNLVEQAPLLADSKTGTSKGDPAAGRELELDVNANRKPSTKADKGGAGALTGIVLILLILFTWWLVKP